MKILFAILVLILPFALYAQEMDTTYVVNEQGKTIGLVHEKGEIPLYHVQQKKTSKEIHKDSRNKIEKDVLAEDSTAYYQDLVNRYLAVGNRSRFTGNILLILGLAGIATGTILVTNYEINEDVSDGYLLAGEISLAVSAPLFLAGIVFRARGTDKLRRADEYENILKQYKRRYTINLQAAPLVDPLNHRFGANVAMIF